MILSLVPAMHAQIFYKVEGKGLEKPSYLFGTHHFASESILDSMPKVEEALKQTECVVGELVMDENPMAMVQVMQSHMMAPADSTLSKLYTAERFAQLDSVFGSLTGGMSLRILEPMKPAAANLTLTSLVCAKSIPETGQIDTYFQKRARLDSIAVAGLETPEFQAEVLFDIVPISKQAESLAETLDDPEELVSSVDKLTEAYLRRDADALWELGKQAESESDAEFFEMLLAKRNERWLEQLPAMMAEKPLFVAVGCLHLYGERGVVEGLRKLGYSVTPVY